MRAAAHGLHCSVRPLGLLAPAGAGHGGGLGGWAAGGLAAAVPGGWAAGGLAAAVPGGLSVDVAVHNRSQVALAGWALAVVYTSSASLGCSSSSDGGSGSSSSSTVVHCCPLDTLPAGSSWRQSCSIQADWLGQGQLLVLLYPWQQACSSGSGGGSSGSGGGSSGSSDGSGGDWASLALLHCVQLDALSFLEGSSSNGNNRVCGNTALPATVPPPQLPLSAKLLLSIPRRGLGHPPVAGLLEQLLQQGLSTQQEGSQELGDWGQGACTQQQVPPITLANAFALVQPHGLAGLGASLGAGGGSSGSSTSSSRQGSLSMAGSSAPACVRASLRRGGTAGSALVELAASAGTAPALLHAHQGLLRRLLLWQPDMGCPQLQDSACPQQQQQLEHCRGIPLPGGQVLVPPPGSTGAAAAADVAALEPALVQLRAAKQQAMALRDDAYQAVGQEQEEQELQPAAANGVAEEGGSQPSAAGADGQGGDLRQRLYDVALMARQAVGCVPVAI